jgi:nitrate reductase delta subunit
VSAARAFKLASVLLQYPTAAIFAGLDDLAAFAAGTGPRAAREAFGRFLAWLRTTEPTDVAGHYVETFDLRRRCALYLTYYRYGDTRKRGMAMLEFKTAYRAAGFAPDEAELPDFLPMVLEFASLTDRGMKLVHGHRADLELLRRALARAGSPYGEIVTAVCAHVPRLSRRELGLVGRAWQEGPPREEVGIEPFAPPEYLAGYGAGGSAASFDPAGARP